MMMSNPIELYDFVRPRTAELESVWRVIEVNGDWVTAEKRPNCLEPRQIERVSARSDFFILLDEEDDDY